MDSIYLIRLACSDLLLRSKFGGVYASDELPQTLDRKKIKAAFSEDEDDVEYMLPRKKQKKKTNTSASGFDLNLCPPSAASNAVKIQPYSIYLGRGIGMEIREFRKNYYIAFSKTVDSEIRNRFNLALDQLPILAKVVEALQEYVKNQPTNSGLY
ncbi:uncharacterized protein TNCT_90251 [Trichonephila clavata]|uniref:Uncharacterized protein n=1 Tax=Trichonephila clavata TaxID=2740835 RepID=A0A8X6EZ62_TRICU|nr:uncharacterized protein TNCT_90251 [Trichonephila clavata]